MGRFIHKNTNGDWASILTVLNACCDYGMHSSLSSKIKTSSIALYSLAGDTTIDRVSLLYVKSRHSIVGYTSELCSDVPYCPQPMNILIWETVKGTDKWKFDKTDCQLAIKKSINHVRLSAGDWPNQSSSRENETSRKKLTKHDNRQCGPLGKCLHFDLTS